MAWDGQVEKTKLICGESCLRFLFNGLVDSQDHRLSSRPGLLRGWRQQWTRQVSLMNVHQELLLRNPTLAKFTDGRDLSAR